MISNTSITWYEPFWSRRRECATLAAWLKLWLSPPLVIYVLLIAALGVCAIMVARPTRQFRTVVATTVILVICWIALGYLLQLIPRGIRIDPSSVSVIGLKRRCFSLETLERAEIEQLDAGKRVLVLKFPRETLRLGLSPRVDERHLKQTLGYRLGTSS